MLLRSAGLPGSCSPCAPPYPARLAEADSNLPQIFRAHFGFVEGRLNDEDEQVNARWLQRVVAGELFGAAMAERTETTGNSVNLTEDGKLFYNDTSVDLAELAQKLKEVKNKESIIIIRADSTVPHGKVVEVMDTVKTEGLSKIAIAVDQAAPPDTTKDNNK